VNKKVLSPDLKTELLIRTVCGSELLKIATRRQQPPTILVCPKFFTVLTVLHHQQKLQPPCFVTPRHQLHQRDNVLPCICLFVSLLAG